MFKNNTSGKRKSLLSFSLNHNTFNADEKKRPPQMSEEAEYIWLLLSRMLSEFKRGNVLNMLCVWEHIYRLNRNNLIQVVK